MPVSFYMYTAIMLATAAASFMMQYEMRRVNIEAYNYRPKEHNYRKA